jgi:hypothetical protein
VIGTDIQNTTLPNKGPAKAAPAEVDDFTCARVRACVRACVYP